MQKDKILIIDDNKSSLQSLSRILIHRGYQCFSACSATEGLKEAVSIHPQIILLDMDMPGMSGFGFLNEIRKHPVLSDVPIVVLSGEKDQEVVREAMDRGAKRYLVKGCTTESLLTTITSFVTA